MKFKVLPVVVAPTSAGIRVTIPEPSEALVSELGVLDNPDMFWASSLILTATK